MSSDPHPTSFVPGDRDLLCTPIPIRITPFSGHIISIEQENWDKIPASEKLFLSHLEEFFPVKEQPAFSAASRDIQYVASNILAAGKGIESIPQMASSNPVVQAELTAVFGMGTPLLTGTGIATYMEAVKEKEKLDRAVARRKEDIGAEKANIVEHMIGAAETGMGVFATGLRPIALESSVQGVDTSVHAGSWLGQLSLAFNSILSFFSIVWFAGIANSFWISLDDIHRLEKGIDHKDLPKTIQFLQSEIDSDFSHTWTLLKERHEEETKNTSTSFEEWLKGVLAIEVKKMAKDFLVSINQEEERSLDFDAMADNLLKNMQSRSQNGGVSILQEGILKVEEGVAVDDMSFTSLQWVALESIHRHRLERGKRGFIKVFGEELATKVCDYIKQEHHLEETTREILGEIQSAINVQRRISIVGVVFGGIGSAAVAGGYGAAIAAYFPLLTAAGIVTAALSVIVSYVDIHSVLNKMKLPEGKYEERMNNIKIFIGVAMIVLIVALASGATFGAVPGAIAFSALVAVVAIYIARRVKTHFRRIEEQKILCSAKDLINLRNKVCAIQDGNKKTEQIRKIQRLVHQKLERTPLKVAPSLKKTLIEEIDKDIWAEKVREWENLEQETANALKQVFDSMAEDKESYTLWERMSEFFHGIPHLSKAFPSPEPNLSTSS